MVISMLKIRRPLGRLIFNMGIAIPGKTVFLIETAPRYQGQGQIIAFHIYCGMGCKFLSMPFIPASGRTFIYQVHYHLDYNNDDVGRWVNIGGQREDREASIRQ